MLITWMLAVATAGEPTSLRGAASGELFREGLDLLVQPARLTQVSGSDVWSILALRSTGPLLSGGAVASVGRGRLGAYIAWDRFRDSSSVNGEVVEATVQRQDRARIDVAGAMPAFGRVSLGLGGWFEGAWQRETLAWTPLATARPATATEGQGADLVALRQHDVDAGLRAGVAARLPEGRLDVHLQLALQDRAATVHGGDASTDFVVQGFADPLVVQDAQGQPRRFDNRRTWTPGLLVESLTRTAPRTALRTWARLDVPVGGVAVDTFQELAGTDGAQGARQFAWKKDEVLGTRGTLLLLGHVSLRDVVALRFGGRIDGGFERFSATRVDQAGASGLATADARSTVAVSSADVSLSVLVAMEAQVHPRVTLRAFAMGTWSWRSSASTERALGATQAASLGSQSEDTSLAASVGVRWTPVPVVSWDVQLLSAWSSVGQPSTRVWLDTLPWVQLASNGDHGTPLSLATSIVIHL